MNHVHLKWKVFLIDAMLGRRMEMELLEAEGRILKLRGAFGYHLNCGTEILKLCMFDFRNVDLWIGCCSSYG
jgi:hypothetical protein